MKAHADCVPCVFAQVLRAARRVTDDENKLFDVLSRAMELLHDRLSAGTPADISTLGLRAVGDVFGPRDLYADERRHTNQTMLALEPELRRHIAGSPDPVRTALRIAAAANMIDFGITDDVDVHAAIARSMAIPFAVDHTEQLIEDLSRSTTLLYLADNSGEIVADKLLLETIAHPNAWVAVRGAPMLNDATAADAVEVGLDRVANVISNGSDRLGTVLDDCSPQLRQCFDQADVIISKGQANYESLEHVEAPTYFILTAKCRLVARQLGVEPGDLVVARTNHHQKGV
ncbi:MAG TPA: ARMT1-like domain-containing protein [Vicinamibacterales bacterium]|nr:ARMT1-like domain-containing protein [Vicinamibacterales bacterium]